MLGLGLGVWGWGWGWGCGVVGDWGWSMLWGCASAWGGAPAVLLYSEISWYYLVTQIIEMLWKIAYEQHSFRIIITWFFYLLSKYELFFIRETCIGVEKFISAVPFILILLLNSVIHSLVHATCAVTCNAQGAVLGRTGSKNINPNDIKLLFVPKLDCYFWEWILRSDCVSTRKTVIILSWTRGLLPGLPLPHMQYSEVGWGTFSPFLVKVILRSWFVLCCFLLTSRSNQTTEYRKDQSTAV